ncbi:MAG: CapA family protein, partial [Oscillospiraceae bacterium]
AFLPITQYTNGLSLKKDSPMRYIRCEEIDVIDEQIKLMEASSDFQIVSVHWGIENSIDESQNQRDYAQMLCSKGVDLIIGHHPHTLQPTEWIEAPNGNRTLVAYSLGNFVSGMADPQNMLGGILEVKIFKDGKTGETGIKSAQMHPIVTQYRGSGKSEVTIYPFSEYSEELCTSHGIRLQYPNFSMKYLQDIIRKNIPPELLPKDVENKLNI